MVKQLLRHIKNNNRIAFLLSFIAIGTIIGPLVFNRFFYFTALLIFFFANARGRDWKIMGAYVLLIAGAIVSLLFNEEMAIFKAHERLAYFVLISLPISPMIRNASLDAKRMTVLNYLLILSVAVAVTSFICYFLGINYMRNTITGENSVNTAGWFGGITVHSMLLGPISALGTTYATWRLMTKEVKTKKERNLSIGLIFVCLAATMLSASRGATVAGLAGSAIVYILKKGNKKQVLRGILSLMLIGLVALPLLKPFMAGVEEKQSKNIESGGTFDSRQSKWDNRIAEFKSSPIVGSGFATVSLKSGDYSNGGIIEPGTSWLSVLSMLGIVGVISIYLIVFKPMIKVYKRLDSNGVLLIGVFCVFLLHMMTEGYIFAGGNFLFFYFWLFVGAVHAHLANPNYEII